LRLFIPFHPRDIQSMTSVESNPAKGPLAWYFKPFVWIAKGMGYLIQFLFILWGTLAIYYSNLPWGFVRLALAAVFLGFGVWALWITRRPRMGWVFVGVYLCLLAWWSTIKPSHDRDWRPEVAVMPRAIIDGDRVRFTGFRNFDYRSRDDFTVRYEEREVQISHLTGVDFYISYWQIGPVSHTFLSFMFDNAPPVSISIETRPEVGEGFDPIASLFKEFELIYVVGDERDLVRVRTNYRNEDVFLYRLNITPENARGLFRVYLQRINELADHPEFYHLLSNSCTINIVRYANKAGRAGRLDIGHVLNGLIDGYLYRSGRLNSDLPFDELRRRSWINEVAQAAGNTEDFYQRIRANLPTINP